MENPKAFAWTHRLALLISFVVATYSVCLALGAHAGFPTSPRTHTFWPWLADRPFGEDGYYMLAVAYNFAQSHHLVYTYNMPATGIQPLYTLVLAAIAFLLRPITTDRWVLVRILILFGSALFILFSWMMGHISGLFVRRERRPEAFLLGFLLTIFDFTLFRLFTYGLETGIYLLLFGVCLIIWYRIVRTAAKWSDVLLFGIVSGLAGLARIDFGICLLCLLIFLWLSGRASFLKRLQPVLWPLPS